MEHDPPFVYQVQAEVVIFLEKELPHITEMEYFSDGCAAQYKNFKNILNLCHHLADFGITARCPLIMANPPVMVLEGQLRDLLQEQVCKDC